MKEAVSETRFYPDGELVEAGICLLIRCRFDKLNDQLVLLRQHHTIL